MLGPEGAHELVDFMSQVAPALSDLRRVSPVKVRRASKEIRELLAEQGVAESTATVVSKPLAELSADEQLVVMLKGMCKGRPGEGQTADDGAARNGGRVQRAGHSEQRRFSQHVHEDVESRRSSDRELEPEAVALPGRAGTIRAQSSAVDHCNSPSP